MYYFRFWTDNDVGKWIGFTLKTLDVLLNLTQGVFKEGSVSGQSCHSLSTKTRASTESETEREKSSSVFMASYFNI